MPHICTTSTTSSYSKLKGVNWKAVRGSSPVTLNRSIDNEICQAEQNIILCSLRFNFNGNVVLNRRLDFYEINQAYF